ncbi:MAG: hypothetical protein GY797_02885 [Deltaproteobacteria bacterium]|nr:hypothetical protein [Deltaproteobacteria bacterium]
MKVDGIKEVSAWFDAVSDRVKNPQDALQEVSQITHKSIEKNYSDQGRPRWKKRKHIYRHPILWETGAKRERELQSALAPWIRQGSGWELIIFSTFYGAFHQEGRGQKVRKSAWIQPHEIVAMYSALLTGFFHIRITGFDMEYK